METAIAPKLERAWYHARIADFLETATDSVLGALAINSNFAITEAQRDAWVVEIGILHRALEGLEGTLFLEFVIPRLGGRIDAVLLIGPCVFVLEFKVGEEQFRLAALEQVWDYALDLKNFHQASHQAIIVPVLIATRAPSGPREVLVDSDGVRRPVKIGAADLSRVIRQALTETAGESLDANFWADAPYRPTPTIIEAARALYRQHSVGAILRFDAGAKNLGVTTKRIDEIVRCARSGRQKAICFVTGVPGAGKTLVGLNAATNHPQDDDSHAVFLSGNGPLVEVLQEALTRDEYYRRHAAGERVRKGETRQKVKSFVQNVHHFRDEGLRDENRPPSEHVVIFDEAQRAWNLQQTANFMQRRRKIAGFDRSEPEFLISTMDRRDDWAVIICLVGGGQEINTGEAGIGAWLAAALRSFPHWNLHVSPRLNDSEYACGPIWDQVRRRPRTYFDDDLHLAVSMRSFRAESVSAFVKALLDCDQAGARLHAEHLGRRYPIVLTRDLGRAKGWVRERARGSERFGMLASSKAFRLKPHAIDVRVEVNPVHWFLNDRDDTRSSYYLEDAATEFHVQGLELDWACVTWDGDLRFNGGGWSHHDFRGDRWTRIRRAETQAYQRNAYRVLLTRARQGMVIFVPPGDPGDPTRSPEYYNRTFGYLRDCGIPELTG